MRAVRACMSSRAQKRAQRLQPTSPACASPTTPVCRPGLSRSDERCRAKQCVGASSLYRRISDSQNDSALREANRLSTNVVTTCTTSRKSAAGILPQDAACGRRPSSAPPIATSIWMSAFIAIFTGGDPGLCLRRRVLPISQPCRWHFAKARELALDPRLQDHCCTSRAC